MKTAKEIVDLGIRFLDETWPSWRKNVHSDGFELSNPCQCVLGQSFPEPTSPSNPEYRFTGFNVGQEAYMHWATKNGVHGTTEGYRDFPFSPAGSRILWREVEVEWLTRILDIEANAKEQTDADHSEPS